MAFVTVTCPVCGGQAHIEAGKSAMCPYCATELNVPNMPEDEGYAFAPPPDVQFAPPPAPQTMQQPMMQQPNLFAAPQMNPAQFAVPMRQRFSQEELQTARKKRNQWRFLNIGMIGIQALIMTFAIGLLDYFYEDGLGGLIALAWLFSQPVCAILSGATRPDDAYIEQKPLFKKKWLQSLMHFLISLPASAAAGGILYAILGIIAGIF